MLSTIVTAVLATIALVLAMRNARIQQEQRRRNQDSPDDHS
jgi:hypothetical protein